MQLPLKQKAIPKVLDPEEPESDVDMEVVFFDAKYAFKDLKCLINTQPAPQKQTRNGAKKKPHKAPALREDTERDAMSSPSDRDVSEVFLHS